jgi:hypothetical protein
MLLTAVVVAEAASGLRLNISNDGWHAVDLWEETAAYDMARVRMSMQPDPLPGGTEYRGSVEHLGVRDRTMEERCDCRGQLGLAKARRGWFCVYNVLQSSTL